MIIHYFPYGGPGACPRSDGANEDVSANIERVTCSLCRRNVERNIPNMERTRIALEAFDKSDLRHLGSRTSKFIDEHDLHELNAAIELDDRLRVELAVAFAKDTADCVGPVSHDLVFVRRMIVLWQGGDDGAKA